MTVDSFGVWECVVPAKQNGECAIGHDSMIKVGPHISDGATGGEWCANR